MAVSINANPVLQAGDSVITFETDVNTTLTDFVFPYEQETIFVLNEGTSRLKVMASDKTYFIRPNESIKITDNTTTLQIKSDYDLQPFRIIGRVKADSIIVDPTARSQIDSLMTSLADNTKKIANKWVDITLPPYNAKGDGVTDDTAAFQQAITDGVKTIYAPKPSTAYKITSLLFFNECNLIGAGSGLTAFWYYGTGLAFRFSKSNGGEFGGFTIISKASGQSGVMLSGGINPKMQDITVQDFDTVGIQVGNISTQPTAQGVYFANIDNIQITNPNNIGTTGLLVDGNGIPSTNANTIKNWFVKGKWQTLVEVRGNKNIFIGGDAELNNSLQAITQAFKISGNTNQFIGTYIEQVGATLPSTIVLFTQKSYGNRFSDVSLNMGVPQGGIDSRINNQGWNNEFYSLAIGYNFPFNGRNVSGHNLVPNSGFDSIDPVTGLTGWVNFTPNANKNVSTSYTRGGKNSFQITVSAAHDQIEAFISTSNIAARNPVNPIPIGRLRGKTLLAGVWCLTTVPGMGGIRLTQSGSVLTTDDGASSFGAASHSGSGNWEFLTAMSKVPIDATEVSVQLRSDINNYNDTGTVYFSEPIVVVGTELPLYTSRHLTDSDAALVGRITLAPPRNFVDQATTPDVSIGNFFKVSNSAAVTITNFTNGRAGQEITLLATNANTTLSNNGNIATKTAANKVLALNSITKLIYDGTKWYEI